MTEVTNRTEVDFYVGGVKTTNVRFADDGGHSAGTAGIC